MSADERLVLDHPGFFRVERGWRWRDHQQLYPTASVPYFQVGVMVDPAIATVRWWRADTMGEAITAAAAAIRQFTATGRQHE